MKSVWNT
ncbi:unnamed protein product, partial [Allacma fusca]